MIRTWDIFDTLIARRCIFPQNIFAIVEQTSRIKNFAAARMTAERNVVERQINYTLDDIYNELQRVTNASKDFCDKLKELEIEVELEQSIPIKENLRQVQSGDILISDMYLPKWVIRKILNKAGLFVPVEIVVTSGGKSSGRIWQQIASQNEFVFHVGDNLSSDVQKPVQYGFESAPSVLSNPTQYELWLAQRNFNFGTYLRELRLKNPFTEEIKRTYWKICTINIGILIILVQLIDNLQKNYEFEYLGFCGRDTYYLQLLYQKYKEAVHETPVENDYLYYSRKLVRRSENDMGKYFSSRINGRKALMIDLTGTGVHLHKLRAEKKLNYAVCICFLMDKGTSAKKLYPDAEHFPSHWVTFDGEFHEENVSAENFTFFSDYMSFDFFEFVNRATHNTPLRLNTMKIGENLIPNVIFSEINDTENYDVLEACVREALNTNLDVLRWNETDNSFSVLAESLRGLLEVFIALGQGTLLHEKHTLNATVRL